MRELAAAEAEHPRRLVIDLSELTFIDSTGLWALLRAREHAHDADWELVLRRGPDAVHRVLELTRSAEGRIVVGLSSRRPVRRRAPRATFGAGSLRRSSSG